MVAALGMGFVVDALSHHGEVMKRRILKIPISSLQREL
jgi:hypothetical protein